MSLFIDLLQGGWATIQDYLLAHLPFVIPAFFLAGALYALFPKDKILHYLGPDSPKHIAYPMAVAGGLCLAVCSCTILPLFAGIRRSGAGLGPAIVFLYTAPATNILAIVYTSGLIGWEIALARIILSIIFAVFIGITMSAVFPEKKAETGADGASTGAFATLNNNKTSGWLWGFFGVLLAILLWGASPILELPVKLPGLAVLIITLILVARRALNKDMFISWMRETWFFVRTILPLLLIGIFIAGMLKVVIPADFVKEYFGGTSLTATLGAVLFGVVAYFPTLVEVPMARLFLDVGVGWGPLVAYLLADPVLSLPSILVVRKMIGNKRLLLYVGLIIVCCTAAGLIYGAIAG
jgi:uncharacterized membrane protein YraQ (UPF0718 family)